MERERRTIVSKPPMCAGYYEKITCLLDAMFLALWYGSPISCAHVVSSHGSCASDGNFLVWGPGVEDSCPGRFVPEEGDLS